MAKAALLIDSDVFLVLAGAGVLDQAIELLGCDRDCAFRRAPLPQMIGRSASLQACYSADVRRRAQVACTQIAGIGDRPRDDILQRLLTVTDIDDGEALLYGLLAECPLYLLASGDKRAMLALSGEPSVADIREAVAGRVICLESILRRMVLRDGVNKVAPHFRCVRDSHQSLRVILSDANSSDQAQCLKALDSYLRDLTRAVGQDFLYEM